MDIDKALEQTDGGEVEVTGFLLVDRLTGSQFLCSYLLESDPPQCGGHSIEFLGPPPDSVQLHQGTDMAWSDRPVTLRGIVSERVLRLEP